MNKQVITRAVIDIESGHLLEQESYLYDGPWASLTPPKALDEECTYHGGVFQFIVQNIVSAAAAAVLASSLIAGTIWLQDEQTPALSTPVTVPGDEDYWQNPTRPVPATLYQQLPYLPDPEEIPAGVLSGQPDEDYWQNPVAPVPATLRPFWPGDLEEIPAGSLSGQPDEDFWINPVAPVQATLRPFWPGDVEEIPAATLSGQPDEDYWVNWVAPVPATLYRPLPYLPDPEELVVTAGPAFQPDEDYWFNQTIPIQAAMYQPLPYLDWMVDMFGEVGPAGAPIFGYVKHVRNRGHARG